MKCTNEIKACKCVAEFEADQERFAMEAAAAFEEPVENYTGGFVPMRYVEPPKALTLKCGQRCPEASDLLERLSDRATPRESLHPQAETPLPHPLFAQDI